MQETQQFEYWCTTEPKNHTYKIPNIKILKTLIPASVPLQCVWDASTLNVAYTNYRNKHWHVYRRPNTGAFVETASRMLRCNIITLTRYILVHIGVVWTTYAFSRCPVWFRCECRGNEKLARVRSVAPTQPITMELHASLNSQHCIPANLMFIGWKVAVLRKV